MDSFTVIWRLFENYHKLWGILKLTSAHLKLGDAARVDLDNDYLPQNAFGMNYIRLLNEKSHSMPCVGLDGNVDLVDDSDVDNNSWNGELDRGDGYEPLVD